MNVANITAKFSAFSGLSGEELSAQSAIIDCAVDYITALVKPQNPTEEQTQRLESLCAAYAYKLYGMRGVSQVTSFTAGDVKITSPDGANNAGEKLWQEMKNANADLLRGENYLFGRM